MGWRSSSASFKRLDALQVQRRRPGPGGKRASTLLLIRPHGFFTRKQSWVAPAGVFQVGPRRWLKASAACCGGRPLCVPGGLVGHSSRASRRLPQDAGSLVVVVVLVGRVGVVSGLCSMRRRVVRSSWTSLRRACSSARMAVSSVGVTACAISGAIGCATGRSGP